MMVERSEVLFGTTRIPYRVRRTARVKTVSISVEPEGGVLLRAPKKAPIERLDAIVRQKARWIIKRVRGAEDVAPAPAPREFVSGETYLYLGRQYRLRVVHGGDRGPDVRLERGRLVVEFGRGVGGIDEIRELLVGWFREHASARLPALVDEWSSRLNLQPARVLVTSPRSRWGSCSPTGDLRLNWRIIGAPKRLIEYVVVHELIHLVHVDHTRAFWRELGLAMSNYEQRREALRVLGPGLVW